MQLQYELSPDDVRAAQKLFQWRRRRFQHWAFTVYGVLFFLFGVWEVRRGLWSVAAVPLVFGALCTVYAPLIMPWLGVRKWKQQSRKHGLTTLSTSSEGLEITSPMSRAIVRWEAFDGILEGPTLWLLFLSNTNYLAIPKRALASDEERALFRAELARIGTPSPSSAPPISSP